jgi:hypothetical protein
MSNQVRNMEVMQVVGMDDAQVLYLQTPDGVDYKLPLAHLKSYLGTELSLQSRVIVRQQGESNPLANGNYAFNISGNSLLIERREGGNWVEKQKIEP